MADVPPALSRRRKDKTQPPPIERLIVPLDGTHEAETAITPALKIARQLQIPLELFTVHDPVRGRWATGIDSVAGEIGYAHVEVVCVSAGWAGDHLIHSAQETPGAVICLATHNRDRFSRMITGSVTEHVIRHSARPVLMVGPEYEPAFEPDQYRDCIVCLDGSGRDEAALHTARVWAQQLDLTLHLVHIDSPSKPEEPRIYEETLASLASDFTQAGIRADYSHLTDSDIAEGIMSFQTDTPGTLAVLTSRNRGVTRWVLGSVTATVLAHTTSPVLLAKPAQHL
ncbi:universal stress protein [Hoyosella altamirensis]|uniref:Nucleotide-binding universal stress UspA family protein n=1 Tax=Hoyosella altamirensis TaxID=616997 RepID=A0A839RUJ1_9ACTN|nr:universal stress protein [Hoyosella altamirensis]MBB3040019.1 nucleotide-binding universal stress UspA family protein [Hoyosella altamirensis]